MRIVVEIGLILILILANGLLAMSEIAIVAARKARLRQRADEGNEKASVALALANQPSDFLATVQIGITSVGILAGVFSGATIAEQIAIQLNKIPAVSPYSELIAIIFVVFVITYFSLVFGELAPKRWALTDPERVAIRVAIPMRNLSRIGAPLVRFLSFSTNSVLRLFGRTRKMEPAVTEEEIKFLVEQGAQIGVLEVAEQEMIVGVLRLGDLRVEALMVPRTEIEWLDLEDDQEINRSKIIQSQYHRLPVAIDSLDQFVGVAKVRDLLPDALEGVEINLRDHIHEALFLPESLSALKALDRFREAKEPMALVIDEYGGLLGLITAVDILDAVIGEIPEIDFEEHPRITVRKDGTYLIDGALLVDEFKDYFDISELPDEQRDKYQTIGGFVMAQLGRIPTTADSFEWGGMRFEVVDMDGFRVDKVILYPPLGDGE